MCLGLFDDSKRQIWDKRAKEDGLKGRNSHILLEVFLHKFLKLFQKKIWIPRCQRVIDQEYTQDINKKAKKRKTETPQRRRNKRDLTANNSYDSQKNSPLREKDKEKKNYKEKVREIIWSWIRESKKWLSL